MILLTLLSDYKKDVYLNHCNVSLIFDREFDSTLNNETIHSIDINFSHDLPSPNTALLCYISDSMERRSFSKVNKNTFP